MTTISHAVNSLKNVHSKDTDIEISQSLIGNEFSKLTGPGLASFDHLRVTAEKDYPNQDPVITWNSSGVAAPGNITVISAAAKAGKTAFQAVLVSCSLTTCTTDSFTNICVTPANEKAVIHMDSEQSEADQQYLVKSILKRAGLTATPANYLSYNIRQIGINDYQATTDSICEAASNDLGGIHMIVIDGGADYIKSVNDEEQAHMIVEYFTHLSIKYSCPVIIIVHLNPGTDKERGHFGSQLQRKCYGLISIKKDGDISIAEPKIMRKAGLDDLQPIYYKYCKDKGYHVQIDAPDNSAKKDLLNRQKHELLAKEVFAPPIALKFTDSVEALMQATNKGERTAKQMISNMKGWGILKHGDDGFYRLNIK